MKCVQERQAWYTLGIFAATGIAFAAAVALLGLREQAFAALALFGLSGFAPLIGRAEKRAGKVIMDERDRAIERAAGLAGFGAVWLCYVLTCIGSWAILGNSATIPVRVLPLSVFVAMVIVFTTRAAVIVILYRRGSCDAAL
jgi:hypothetical protein